MNILPSIGRGIPRKTILNFCKRYLLYPILLLAALLGLTVTVSADIVTASPYRELIDGYDEAYLRMYEAIAAGEESADLTDLKIKAGDISRIYGDIVASCPEFFYLDSKIAYGYVTQGFRDYVTAVNFRYTMDESEREEASLNYEAELAYIVSLADPSMTELELALWAHDYIIASFSYDDSQTIFDAYRLFTERTGVCQADSLAYVAEMRELGVDAVMVSSPAMNHAWNLVKIDGVWYHVDLVYDDPSPDRIGRVLHENFLLDDEAIQKTENPHYGWESAFRCSSRAEGIWSGITSRMIYIERQWYYIDPKTSTFSVSLIDGRYRSDIYTFSDKWYVEGMTDRYWMGVFSGLSECLGYLFINTPQNVLIYAPDTGKMDIFIEETERRIFGSVIYKNTVEYLLASSPDDEAAETGIFTITDFNIHRTVTILPFDDVSRLDSYYSAVRYVYGKGLFQGVSSTKFAPDATLTRAMFVTVLGRLCGVDTEDYDDDYFLDVEPGQWYTPYVEWAARWGIVNGIGNSLFDPMGEITHEQMYKIVARCGVRLYAGDLDFEETVLLYEDRDAISDWAIDGVSYCMKNDLIVVEDDGVLAPAEKSTRAEAAEIVSRFAILCGIA